MSLRICLGLGAKVKIIKWIKEKKPISFIEKEIEKKTYS